MHKDSITGEEVIDLSDNHILSVEEIKAHSYKDIKEGDKHI